MENRINVDQMRDSMAKIMEGLSGVVKFAEESAKNNFANMSAEDSTKFEEALKAAKIKQTRSQVLTNVENLVSEFEKLNNVFKQK